MDFNSIKCIKVRLQPLQTLKCISSTLCRTVTRMATSHRLCLNRRLLLHHQVCQLKIQKLPLWRISFQMLQNKQKLARSNKNRRLLSLNLVQNLKTRRRPCHRILVRNRLCLLHQSPKRSILTTRLARRRRKKKKRNQSQPDLSTRTMRLVQKRRWPQWQGTLLFPRERLLQSRHTTIRYY